MKPIQLQDIHRRTNRSIDSFYNPDQLLNLIKNGKSFDYKKDPEYYSKRDKALASLEVLTCGRISEILRIKRSQFQELDDRFIILKDFQLSKRKKRTIERFGLKLVDLPLPLKGRLSGFTTLALGHIAQTKEDLLFPFERAHAYKIIKNLTGFWNHFFRAQALSYYINLLKNPIAVGRIYGVENVNTLMWYYRGAWEDYKDEFSK